MITTAEITTLAGAVALGILQAWTIWQQKHNTTQIDKVVQSSSANSDALAANTEATVATGKTVDIIHTLTNSQKGVTLKALAEVTAAKFAITHDAADQKAAALALADYLSHVDNQTRADAGTPKPKDT